MAHWTRNLPEFGRCYIVDAIEKNYGDISKLRAQISELQKQIKKDEAELLKMRIEPNWTKEEIESAKRQAATL